jgi:hypothetical protein
MDPIFSSQSNISQPEINLGKDDKPFIFFMFIIIIIAFFIVVIPWDKLSKKREGMSGGTIAQMFSQDSQDVYLKGNVDKLATGNFNLFWNQPTREANVFQNRGQPLYSILLPDTPMNPTPNMLEVSNNYVNNIINNEVLRKEDKLTFSNPVLRLENVLPKSSQSKSQINSLVPDETKDYETVNDESQAQTDYLTFPEALNSVKYNKNQIKSVPTLDSNVLPSSIPIGVVANSNPYELSKVAQQVAIKKSTSDNLPKLTNWTPEDYLFQAYTDRAINNKDCINDPASCTGFYGTRLANGFVQSTKTVPYVNLDGNTFYPDSYVGSYWYPVNFDINKPYPFMPNKNRV